MVVATVFSLVKVTFFYGTKCLVVTTKNLVGNQKNWLSIYQQRAWLLQPRPSFRVADSQASQVTNQLLGTKKYFSASVTAALRPLVLFLRHEGGQEVGDTISQHFPKSLYDCFSRVSLIATLFPVKRCELTLAGQGVRVVPAAAAARLRNRFPMQQRDRRANGACVVLAFHFSRPLQQRALHSRRKSALCNQRRTLSFTDYPPLESHPG